MAELGPVTLTSSRCNPLVGYNGIRNHTLLTSCLWHCLQLSGQARCMNTGLCSHSPPSAQPGHSGSESRHGAVARAFAVAAVRLQASQLFLHLDTWSQGQGAAQWRSVLLQSRDQGQTQDPMQADATHAPVSRLDLSF